MYSYPQLTVSSPNYTSGPYWNAAVRYTGPNLYETVSEAIYILHHCSCIVHDSNKRCDCSLRILLLHDSYDYPNEPAYQTKIGNTKREGEWDKNVSKCPLSQFASCIDSCNAVCSVAGCDDSFCSLMESSNLIRLC